MRKHKILFLITCVPFISLLALIPFSGKFLVLNDPPVKSDAIILLTGGGIERLTKAVELYKTGYAPVIIISNALEDNFYQAAIDAGVSQQDLIQETKADSTYTNAQYTYDIMRKHAMKSAIVVSSDYHMRRVKFNFERFFGHSDIRLTYCSAPTNYNSELWWADQASRATTFDEYIKILGNALGFNGETAKSVFHNFMKKI